MNKKLKVFSAAAGIIAALWALPALGTVLSPIQGGTGASSTPVSGQVLIGNSGGTYTPAYLTAGSNITIATSSGGISISASTGAASSSITINGLSTSTFNFLANGTGLSVATSAPNTVTYTWTNPGYITSAPATTTINGLQSPSFNFVAAGTGLTIATSSTSTLTFTWTNPGYLTTAITSINGLTGPAITFQGTTNRITVATSTNTVTLSTPQDIATTSNVQFGTVGIGTSSMPTGYYGNVVGTSASGTQFNIQNTASTSYSQYVLTADNGSTSTNYGGVGINNSNFTGGPYASTYSGEGNYDVYLEAQTSSLDLETLGPKPIQFFTGGAATSNLRMLISATGTVQIKNVTSSILATDASGNIVATTTSAGGSSAGSAGNVQYASSTAGKFDATSTFTFTSSTNQLGLNNVSSSEIIGPQSSFPTIVTASSVTFAYSGAIASWTVPANIASAITVNAVGAGGGNGYVGSGGTMNGGFGGSATGTLTLASSTPGSIIYFNIGGRGSDYSTTSTVAGGYNGGGSSPINAVNITGGSGGGFTWVSPTSTFATSTVYVAAAGGGGSGSNRSGNSGQNFSGGAGGGLTGSAGTVVGGGNQTSGGGGTQTAGGGAGVQGNATAGSAGQGGNGASNQNASSGGGGGGGCYGGGGGGEDTATGGVYNGSAPGGGGSSCFSSNLTSTSTAASTNTGNGSVTFTFNVYGVKSSNFAIAAGGHVITGNPATPSVTACGTSPTISGNDTAGVITTGSGTVTSCQLNFAQAYPNAPIVTGNLNVNATVYISSDTTTSTVFSFSASSPSDKLYYHVFGY